MRKEKSALSPAVSVPTDKKPKSGLSKAVAGAFVHAPLLSAGLIISIAGAIITALLPPLVLEKIINSISDGSEISMLLPLLYFASLAFSGLFDALREIFITLTGQNITLAARELMCKKLTRLPASYFVRTEPGATVSRFVNDVDTLEALFTSGIAGMTVDIFRAVSIIAVIFVKSPGLGIIITAVTPFLCVFTAVVRKKILRSQKSNRAAVARVTSHVPETVKNIRMIHVFGLENYMREKYFHRIEQSYRAVDRTNFYDSVYSPVIMVTCAAVTAVMMVLAAARGGGLRELFGMSVGTAVAVTAYVGKVFSPIESIGMEIQSIQAAVAGVSRIKEFLCEPERELPRGEDAKSTERNPGGKSYVDETRGGKSSGEQTRGGKPGGEQSRGGKSGSDQTHGGKSGSDQTHGGTMHSCKTPNAEQDAPAAVELNDVSFSYNPGYPVLKGLSFSLKEGESVTLAGRTGAGKSTVFKLLLGFYPADSGDVKIYGTPASEIPDSQKRRLFGFVEQTFRPVRGSVGDQISVFDETITRDEVVAAARTVGIDEAIAALPDGYDTVYSDNLFSQGQRQLLSVARAAVAEPKIMLLDEITANLDSETEKAVLEALRSAVKNRTVISVSHRLYEHIGGRVIFIEGK